MSCLEVPTTPSKQIFGLVDFFLLFMVNFFHCCCCKDKWQIVEVTFSYCYVERKTNNLGLKRSYAYSGIFLPFEKCLPFT